MKKRLLFLLVSFLSFFVFAQSRNALVISNYDYFSNPISSGKKDGDDVAELLKGLDFNVVQDSNLNQRKLVSSVKNFVSSVRGGAYPDIVFLYYRGYAVQTEGKNYLIPTDTDILSEQDISLFGLCLDDLIERLQSTNAKQILIFLDCCDENPWQKLVSNSKDGLAYTEISSDSEITLMFSQALNKNTLPWKSENSLFTQYFLEEIGKPNEDIRLVCSNIAASVKKFSGGNQVPWINSTIVNSFVLNSKNETPVQESESVVVQEAPQKETQTVKMCDVLEKKGIHQYKIAFFGVTFDLYKEVVMWAKNPEREDDVYRFKEFMSLEEYEKFKFDSVDGNKIVKDEEMLDAIVWANAFSEYSGLSPVYYEVPENTIFRDSFHSPVSIAVYLNQDGYRFPLKKEKENAINAKLINEHYTGYLLAMSDGDLSTYDDPKVKVAKEVPGGLKFVAAVLNPVLGLGSYIEGDISGGIGFTFWQGLGLGTAYFGYYVTERWKTNLEKKGASSAKIDYLIPNIIVGSGLGIYGVSAVIGLFRPLVHSPIKKKTFSVPTLSGESTDVVFDFSPGITNNGDLAMCLTFAW